MTDKMTDKMTLEEAQICLSILVEVKHRLGRDFEAKALQLGLEALKRHKLHKTLNNPMVYSPLPGETEE